MCRDTSSPPSPDLLASIVSMENGNAVVRRGAGWDERLAAPQDDGPEAPILQLHQLQQHQQEQQPEAPNEAPTSQEDAAASSPPTSNDACGSTSDVDLLRAEVADLQRRVTAAEDGGGQQKEMRSFMSAMHTWASQTAANLRSLEQQVCRAQGTAQTSQQETAQLKFTVHQLQANLEATTTALEQLTAHVGPDKNNYGAVHCKRHRSISRADTSASLVQAGDDDNDEDGNNGNDVAVAGDRATSEGNRGDTHE